MKKKRLIALLWVLLIGFFLSLMPWHRTVCVQTTLYEYALDQQTPLRTHDVTIEGKYFYGIWRDPYFDGFLSVSGFPFTREEPARIHFRQEYGYLGLITFRDAAGQPRSRELGQFRGTTDFSEFVLMVFEQKQHGDQVTSTWNPETGRLLCTNAPDYEALQAQCKALAFDIWEGE